MTSNWRESLAQRPTAPPASSARHAAAGTGGAGGRGGGAAALPLNLSPAQVQQGPPASSVFSIRPPPSSSSSSTSPVLVTPTQGTGGGGGGDGEPTIYNETFYNDEAQKIFDKVQRAVAGDPSACAGANRYSNLDAIYALPKKRDPVTGVETGGGCIYVGNHSAAAMRPILDQHNISHIVNCTHGASAIRCFFLQRQKGAELTTHMEGALDDDESGPDRPNNATAKTPQQQQKQQQQRQKQPSYGFNVVDSISNKDSHNKGDGTGTAETERRIRYYRFPVSDWKTRMATRMQSNGDKDAHRAVMDFIQPMFNFIESALLQGTSVLIHCLAGAHRAGTTGVLSLMYFHNKYNKKQIQNNTPAQSGTAAATATTTGQKTEEAEWMTKDKAKIVAKQLRPAIDPIGRFPEFLAICEGAILTKGLDWVVSENVAK